MWASIAQKAVVAAAHLLGVEWTHQILGLEATTRLARLLSVVAKRNAGAPVPHSRVPWLPRTSSGGRVWATFVRLPKRGVREGTGSPCVP